MPFIGPWAPVLHQCHHCFVGVILRLMLAFPKPRGFWDYALFAFLLTGSLLFLFWSEASDGIRWGDATLALTVAILSVVAIVLSRRREKAKWMRQPTWFVYSVATLGTIAVMYGAAYADAYLLHRGKVNSGKLSDNLVYAVIFAAVMLWSSRKR